MGVHLVHVGKKPKKSISSTVIITQSEVFGV